MNKTVQHIFNSKAKLYADKYMDMSMYKDTFISFNETIKSEDPTVLDIACGPGNITKYIKNTNSHFNIIGVDFAPEMLKVAKEQNPDCTFENLNALDIDKLENTFDGIICGFLLPYLTPEEVISLFNKVYNKLNKLGVFYLSTMNSESNYSEMTTSKSEPKQSMESFYYSKDYLIQELIESGFVIINSSIKLDGYSAPLSELFITCQKSTHPQPFSTNRRE